MFSIVTAPIYISTNSAQVFPILHILGNTCCFLLFVWVFLIIAILICVRWYLSVVFICIYLMISDTEQLIHVPVGHLYVFFGKMSIQVLCPFLNWVACFLILSCMSSLYMLDINLLLDISFANSFFYSVGCLFFFLAVSITMQKLISLM